MKLSFEQASKRIKDRHEHLTLIEYSGSKKEAKFLDSEYGEFSGRYDYVYCGDKNHKDRANKNSRILIEEAKKRLNDRYSNLILLEYNGSKNIAKFYDNEFGEFEANYKSVFSGKQKHPERTRILKKEARNKKIVKEKIKQSFLEKYGCENPSKNEEIKKKKEATTNKNYGVKNPFQSEEIKEKIKTVMIERYGVDKALKSPKIKNKQEETMLNKFGTKHAIQSLIIRDKLNKTNIEKYGCENPFGNETIQFKIKETKLSSGNYHNIDGYSASEYYRNNNIKCAYSSFIQNINNFGLTGALQFNPNKSDIENIINNLLEKSCISFIYNKKINKEYNIRPDFLIKNKKLIIECDGLYYHSDGYGASNNIRCNKNFHKERQEKYKEMGYKSLFFRADEIFNKTSIVESIILAKLGLITNKVFARKTKIIELSPNRSSIFFEDNHLMGRGSGQCYALTYNDKIVSAIRIIKRKDHIDISRFCSALNTNVIGGLGKLLKHVIKEHNPKKIISFVDMRYGDGHSLEKLGFVEKTNHVSFKWTDFKNTYHRMNFKGNSGYEKGMYKIWDCGQKKFELIF